MRKAGTTVGLFSIHSERSWGIGELGDVPDLARWLKRAGQSWLQLLPVFEMPRGESSPYGALSAFAIDPVYLTLGDVNEVDDALLRAALGPEGLDRLARAKDSKRVDYLTVRELKEKVLDAAFVRFVENDWAFHGEEAVALAQFAAREAHWLEDYALFMALRAQHAERSWLDWPAGIRDRDPRALAEARLFHNRSILKRTWIQMHAARQWETMRAALAIDGVVLMGDLPFVVTRDSADVWSHGKEFHLHLSLGAPPDALSAEGQNWGLPPYDMPRMAESGWQWMRARTRRMAQLFDAFRVDHLVGYFRQWVRELEGDRRGYFDHEGDEAQARRGRELIDLFVHEAKPARVIAEDLGIIPQFVRDSLAHTGTPGYKVLPWEQENGQFRDPQAFPEASVATWSTHDTQPITAWFDDLQPWEQAQLCEKMGVSADASEDEKMVKRLAWLYGARSELALTLVQELVGMRERINTPGTVGDDNWTLRLPWSLETVTADVAMRARFAVVRDLVAASTRL